MTAERDNKPLGHAIVIPNEVITTDSEVALGFEVLSTSPEAGKAAGAAIAQITGGTEITLEKAATMRKGGTTHYIGPKQWKGSTWQPSGSAWNRTRKTDD